MTITISTAATILILQQLQLTTAIDNTSSRHVNYMPILKGAKQHAQLAGYIATDSTDPYWSQFNNAMSIHNGNLKPVQQKAEKNDDIIILEAYVLSGVDFVKQLPHFMMVQPNTSIMSVDSFFPR